MTHDRHDTATAPLAPLFLDLWSGISTPRVEQVFLDALADPAFDPLQPCNEQGDLPLDRLLKPLEKPYLDSKRPLDGHDRTALATQLPGRSSDPGLTRRGERLVAALIARGVAPFAGPKPEALWQRCMALGFESLCVQLLDHPDCPDVALLDEAGPNVKGTLYGNPLLHKVFARGMGGLGQALLEKGLDPNRQDGFGHTPLFFAQDVREVEILVAAGCDPEQVNREGITAVAHWTRECPERAPALLERLRSSTAFSKNMAKAAVVEAAFQGRKAELRTALQQHPDLDWDAVIQGAVAGAFRTLEPNSKRLRKCHLGSLVLLLKHKVGCPESRQIARIACGYLDQGFEEKGPAARSALANLANLPPENEVPLSPHRVLDWMSQAFVAHNTSCGASVLMGMAQVLWHEQTIPAPGPSWMSLWTQALGRHLPSLHSPHLVDGMPLFRGFEWSSHAWRMQQGQAGMESVSLQGKANGADSLPAPTLTWNGIALQLRLLEALAAPDDPKEYAGLIEEFQAQLSATMALSPPPKWLAARREKLINKHPDVAAWVQQQMLLHSTEAGQPSERPRLRM